VKSRRPRRGRTPLPEGERKDRLVQARVDEDLDDALREAAKERRLSVSQLVRNVLEDTFKLVDGVVANSTTLATTVTRDARRIAAAARGEKRSPSPLDRVEAWQEVVVARDQACARCGDALRPGDKALLGLTDDPTLPRPWLCLPCGPGRGDSRGS
jgi:hypothetical protein